jgi:hypothetical protein
VTPIQKLKLHSIRVDDTLNVFNEGARAQVVAKAKKALKNGSTVTWEDNSTQWQEVFIKIDSTKKGSQHYTWNKSGEKVLAEIFLATKAPSGKITKKKIGTKYVKF